MPASAMGISKPSSGSGHFAKMEKGYQMPWFTKECETRKAEYFRIKNKLCRLKTEEAKSCLERMKQGNRNVLLRMLERLIYFRSMREKIRALKTLDSKAYWNIIKSDKSPRKIGKVKLPAFAEHFEIWAKK